MSDANQLREIYKAQYELAKKRLHIVRSVNTLRRYVYNLSRDERQYFFTEVQNYLRNELTNNILNIGELEKTAINILLGHWQIASMEANSTNWWSMLLYNYANCDIFLYMIKTCVEEVDETSKDVNDNSSVDTFKNML